MRRLAIVGITTETFWDEEPMAINWLLSNGLDRLHIRKPCASNEQIAGLIHCIEPQFLEKISLHDGHDLADRLGIGGVHLNGRNPQISRSFRGKISRSCHSLKEVIEAKNEGLDYLFLSPIYSSISKMGYESAFSLEELEEAFAQQIIDRRVVALGGVTPSRFGELSALGFGGAALLGYLWGNRTINEIKKRYETCYNSLHIGTQK